jgi:hypothetical protein
MEARSAVGLLILFYIIALFFRMPVRLVERFKIGHLSLLAECQTSEANLEFLSTPTEITFWVDNIATLMR